MTFKPMKTKTLLLCCAVTFCFYYVPVNGYKWLNWKYNGIYVITSRGSWALYGSTARRMEPLNVKRFAEALAFAPGGGVCNSIFGPQECTFWSYVKSDEFGFAKRDELTREHYSSVKLNAALILLSAQKALQNPFQYALLTIVEGLKMFFWESTKVGFVNYPHWLQKIYDIKIFNNTLRFLVSLASLMAVGSLWRMNLTPRRSPIGFLMGVLIFLYISSFSFFFILDRYALPIAPLFLIAIGVWADQILAPDKKK